MTEIDVCTLAWGWDDIMQESGGILLRSVWQDFGLSRWCVWEGLVDWVAPEWISVTRVERNICVTNLKSINFVSDYYTLCVNHSVLYYMNIVCYLQINRFMMNAAKNVHILS
jgi:hypothetical protein